MPCRSGRDRYRKEWRAGSDPATQRIITCSRLDSTGAKKVRPKDTRWLAVRKKRHPGRLPDRYAGWIGDLSYPLSAPTMTQLPYNAKAMAYSASDTRGCATLAGVAIDPTYRITKIPNHEKPWISCLYSST
uniref:Uncharacterized protein n=1 Tax=Candidatus Kentrum sp. TC TaxID=2126339 RepID=A0A450YTD1_9GAMM|nr:MAG: hypothetical protein BECKTC1821E_GA0114239_103914 [Candidatus Kentron sp. TC]